MHLLARDDEVTPDPDPGDRWCSSPEFLTACSGHQQIIEPEMLAAELCIGFDLGWEPLLSRVLADLSVSDRVKEVQGWV